MKPVNCFLSCLIKSACDFASFSAQSLRRAFKNWVLHSSKGESANLYCCLGRLSEALVKTTLTKRTLEPSVLKTIGRLVRALNCFPDFPLLLLPPVGSCSVLPSGVCQTIRFPVASGFSLLCSRTCNTRAFGFWSGRRCSSHTR